jgi:hypothetical protein
MVLAPIGLLFFLLWIANRRAKRQLETAPDDAPTPTGTDPSADVDAARDRPTG